MKCLELCWVDARHLVKADIIVINVYYDYIFTCRIIVSQGCKTVVDIRTCV